MFKSPPQCAIRIRRGLQLRLEQRRNPQALPDQQYAVCARNQHHACHRTAGARAPRGSVVSDRAYGSLSGAARRVRWLVAGCSRGRSSAFLIPSATVCPLNWKRAELTTVATLARTVSFCLFVARAPPGARGVIGRGLGAVKLGACVHAGCGCACADAAPAPGSSFSSSAQGQGDSVVCGLCYPRAAQHAARTACSAHIHNLHICFGRLRLASQTSH
eukprot:scaffold4364_cov119-Isochrysis_galbana.AAC.9